MTVHECHYCQLTHKEVEAGGLYYCPNPACLGPGAAPWRRMLPSYREIGHDRHTAASADIRGFAMAYASSITDDAALAVHIATSAALLRV